MLRLAERRTIFILYCAILISGVATETILALRGVSILNSLLGLLVGFLIGGALERSPSLYIKMISQNFLNIGVTPNRLHQFSSERYRIIADASQSGEDKFVTRTKLVRNTLKFCEDCMTGWVPGTHFEFCSFVDREMPLMFAYFDSGGDFVSRSMEAREKDPNYYVSARYEVVGLLRKPSSQPLILKDTSGTGYTFATDTQRTQIRSTVLFCPDVSAQFALVVTSNKKNAFTQKDSNVLLFIKYVAESICFDLCEDDFLRRIRDLKPELFAT